MTKGRPDHQLLKKRNRRETRFRFYGLATIMVVLTLLGLMLLSICWRGSSVFQKAYFHVEMNLKIPFDPQHPRESLRKVNFRDLIYHTFAQSTDVKDLTRKDVQQLISPGAEVLLMEEVLKDPQMIGGERKISLLASDDVDYFLKHPETRAKSPMERRLSESQMAFLTTQTEKGSLTRQFNWLFFTNGDSRSPELAGIKSALVGSLYTILVTLLLAFPLGIAAAVYIEEFAPRNRFVRFLELNINNLASVPSIVYGLLGLVVFINVMHLPRSSSLVGGMTLALMIMPTIFIATRSALHTVPKTIARAAEAMGASRVQVVFHHKIPLSLPGILTGTILGVARALGESAALLMIGMVAFVVDAPSSPRDPATVLPVQIFNWSRNPEQGFEDHTAAAIMVLLLFLMVMNMGAIYIRKKFEHRW
jgi:phosphate transport system permease protein